MALNATGAISLAGTTTGQSIALELGLSGTAQITMNCTAVRTLAGVASGAITLSNFYGKSNGPSVAVFYGYVVSPTTSNQVRRFNACSANVGSETTVGATKSWNNAGAYVGTNGSYISNVAAACCATTRQITRINSSGTLVGSETSFETVYHNSEAVTAYTRIGATDGIVFGGPRACSGWTDYVDKVNPCGVKTNVSTTIGAFIQSYNAGAQAGAAGTTGVYFGGRWCWTRLDCNGVCVMDQVANRQTVRLNACGAKIGAAITTTPSWRFNLTAAKVGNNGLFYGGYLYGVYLCQVTYFLGTCAPKNIVTRLNACGTLVGETNSIGTARSYSGAASGIGTNGIFQGGALFSGTGVNKITRINACGALNSELTTSYTNAMTVGGGAGV